MAFTRKALKDIGITDETLEKVMQLYGNAMGDYTLKTEVQETVNTAVTNAVTEAKKDFEGLNVEELKSQAGKVSGLEAELAKTKLESGIKIALAKKNYVSEKAALALLDMEKITTAENAIAELETQLTTIETENAWLIPAVAPAAPAAGGLRQAVPPATKTDDQAYLDAKYKNNPFYNKKE